MFNGFDERVDGSFSSRHWAKQMALARRNLIIPFESPAWATALPKVKALAILPRWATPPNCKRC